VPFAHEGAVDVRCTRYPDDVLHLTAPEWLEFLAAVKAGAFDHLAGPGADGPVTAPEGERSG
jgi:hypothetical protein